MKAAHAIVSVLFLCPALGTFAACSRTADAGPNREMSPPKSSEGSSPGPGGSAGGGSATSTSPGAGQAAGRNAGAAPANAGEQVTKTQQLMAHLDAATQAIRQGDDKSARNLLDSMSSTLRTMYENAPGREVLNKMNRPQEQAAAGKPAGSPEGSGAAAGSGGGSPGGGPSEAYAPIAAVVTENQTYLDPDVVANVEKAKSQAQAGNSRAAEESLRLARQKLVSDVALLPIEDAYSRVVAARDELQAGRRENALQLLQNVPVVIAQVQASAPLVPARFDLRAAAAAAEEDNWQRAEQLVGQAGKQLQDVSAAGGAAAKAMKPLAERADKLQSRMRSSNQKPKPREIRALADDIRNASRRM